jgi:Trk K+ transport system NAD-binding subunit/nucleotide-binding universal stress UspA family protein
MSVPEPPTESRRPTVLIIGAGTIGLELARRLLGSWHVTLLDIDSGSAKARLPDGLPSDRIVFVGGDATSRLVLERAGATRVDAVVVTTNDLDVTLETCRILKRELRVADVTVLLRGDAAPRPFQELGVEVVRGVEAQSALLAAAVTKGSKVAAGVGLGHGEVMETEILPNSGVIGKPLASLHPRQWLVAAVYRGEELVIPHGDTRLEAGDRVLLVGAPGILPGIARFLRTGHSEFPLHYGTAIIVPADAAGPTVLPEVAWLARNSKARAVEFLACGDGAAARPLLDWAQAEGLPARVACTGQDTRAHLAEAMARRDVGILVQAPEPIPWHKRLGLGWTPLMRRILPLRSPVLVPRGRFPWERILLVLSDPEFDPEAATLAIDAARCFDASLTVGVALAPEFVTGAGVADELRRRQDEIRDLAASYGVRAVRLEFEGNPVAVTLAACAGFQLLVLGFDTTVRNSLGRPSVAQNLVHRAPCSVLVLPH